MRKQKFFAFVTSYTSSISTTFRDNKVKCEASEFIAILSWIRTLPSKTELWSKILNKFDWCASSHLFWFKYENEFFLNLWPQIQVLFEPRFDMKGGRLRHQNVLPFPHESEYYQHKRYFDPQHSTKLIAVIRAWAFDFDAKISFSHLWP